MTHRCIGIVCSAITGHDVAHFANVVQSASPWTTCDAVIYLAAHGIMVGVGILPGGDLSGRYSIDIDVKDFPLGCLVILAPDVSQPDVTERVTVERGGNPIESAMYHCVWWRHGKWFDPRPGDVMVEVGPPANVWQVWPLYRF
jgi:hypothetical protein